MLFGTRLDPHRVAIREQVIESLFLRNHAAPDGEHRARLVGQYTFERAPLDAAISRLPVERENLLERHSHPGLDFAIQFHERHIHLMGKLRAQRGLSRSS